MGIRSYKWRLLIYLFLLGLILTVIAFAIFAKQNDSGYQRNDYILNYRYSGGNSVIGNNLPYLPEIYILGALGVVEVDLCFYKIIEGESGFNPTICNQKYGCNSGIGMGQLTGPAIKDCEKGLGKKIDPYNKQDNLECSLWLYEKYGTDPWGCPDCWWGSWSYFNEYCD